MHTCIDLLCDQGYIDRFNSLKATYEHYLGIYEIERESPQMWQMVWDHKIQSLFQMDEQSGIQGIALIKPKNVDELAVLNSVIRLMPPDKNSETPLETWAKYRTNINLWYQEMRNYGLTEEEIKWLSTHSAIADGVCESQEGLMSLLQEERLGGHSLNFADKCRKAIAKKVTSLFEECEIEFYKTLQEKHCSDKLGHYVWDILLRAQRGYSFNRSHTLAYSLVGLQEMNLAYRFPIIFWNCACLITNSGGAEDDEEEVVDIYEPEDFDEFNYEDAEDRKTKKKKRKNNNYDKIATAIGKMRMEGINITPPDINTSQYTFYPDVDNNRILFGLRGLVKVGDELIAQIIENRPYISPRDFLNKVKPKKDSMESLIKAGVFDNMLDRKLCMAWYIWEICNKKNNLTLQNMPGLIKYNVLPTDKEEYVFARRVYEFNRYLKACCKTSIDDKNYHLDERALNFMTEIGQDHMLFVVMDDFSLNMKEWDKYYQNVMNIFRNWINNDKENILSHFNSLIFKEQWEDDAEGNISAWEMEAMGFYYHEHELANVNRQKYGFSNFFMLPEDPVIDRIVKGGKVINLFKLSKICGTCIAKNKNKGTVVLLTPDGVVNVRFNKEYFAMFDKRISELGADGKKHVIEKSWFGKGSMIVVQGMRSGDQFIAKKYASSGGGHQLYKITEVLPDGDIVLQTERYQGGVKEDGED